LSVKKSFLTKEVFVKEEIEKGNGIFEVSFLLLLKGEIL